MSAIRRRGGHWPLSVASVLAVACALGGVAPVVQGTTWWLLGIVLAAVAVGTAALVRTRRPFPGVATLAGLFVTVPILTLLFGQGTGFLGVVPTPGTVRVIEAVMRDASVQAYLDAPPATATTGLVLGIAVGAVLVALLVDLTAVDIRVPAFALAPLLLLAVLPARIVGRDAPLGVLVVTAAAFLALLFVDRRRRMPDADPLPALAVGTVALVAALALQATLPAVQPALAGGRGGPVLPLFGPGADVALRLGDTLRRGADVDVLRYRNDADEPAYLRLAVLTDLDGGSAEWEPAEPPEEEIPLAALPDPDGLGDDVESVRSTTTVELRRAVGAWLPLPYAAVALSGSDVPAQLRVALDERTIFGDGADEAMSYTVTSLEARPTADQLRAAATDGRPEALRLPDDVPADVVDAARTVTAGAATDYDRALALQEWFTGPDFVYDEVAPVEEGFDGSGLEVISTFLEEGRGYCVHFSSAMTVMARSLGIPARIAVGYQPGERAVTDSGRAWYTVSAHDLHAWPELFFEGAGWVRFEPTPGRGSTPVFSDDAGADAATPAPEEETPTEAPAPAPSPSASSGTAAGPDVPSAVASDSGPGPVAALALLVAGLLAVPALLRERRRRRRSGPREVAAADGWAELRDSAVDLGAPPDDAATPRSIAASWRDRVDPAVHGVLDRLLVAVETSAYGRPGSAAEVDGRDVRTVADAMRARSPRSTRIGALLLPRSVLRPAVRRRRFGRLAGSRLAFGWSPPGSD